MTLHTVRTLCIERISTFEYGVAVEVFGIDRSMDGLPRFDYADVTPDPARPLVTSSGSRLLIDNGLDALAGADLVIVPAGNTYLGRVSPPPPAEVLDALREAHAAGAIVLSVCSGVFVLAAAGLLDGQPCTAHWHHSEELARRHPDLDVRPDVLFVDNGRVITSAGTAAGIDACLHLVRRELGASVASAIARRMVVPPQRDGGQQQFVERPMPATGDHSLSNLLNDWLDRLDEPHSVRSMAREAAMSPRTFARRFRAEVGTTPAHWLNRQRVARVRELLEGSDLAVEQIARRVGFNSAVVLRDHFRREVGVAPQAYRRAFAAEAG
ncbi:helix-turn-helix domain-containing protein [Naumannella cuiyingiana]|uniref:Transcriptional regulator GlxA family with amidase domain n=1 Tax=Naumannella cuiyingiana TaxID=1347891 RepID=A0A7Z0ILT1_9ACTN|nr:helix-turn-helix domain-containing protein [Naumannella cuiyingiana]NYI71886.1 transcriptional regulator GlxA family with amidase domain [Naumannella cuiyingiana]